MKSWRYIPITLALCAAFLHASFASADESSENYRLTGEQIGSGGTLLATSTNFRVESSIGPLLSATVTEADAGSEEPNPSGGAIGGGLVAQQTAPVISSVLFGYADNGTAIGFSKGITPGIGSTAVHVYGTVINANGADKISNVGVSFYRSGVAGGAMCATDSVNCYRTTSCAVTPTTSFVAHYDCILSVSGFADATDVSGLYPNQYWTAQVMAIDTAGLSSSRTNDVEMNSVTALSIPTQVAFGVLARGATTSVATHRSLELVQVGNTVGDVLLSSNTNLTCAAAGYIPKDNLQWSVMNVGYGAASSTSFTSIPVHTFVNVPRKVSGGLATVKPLYLNIAVPQEGVEGSCNGTILATIIYGS